MKKIKGVKNKRVKKNWDYKIFIFIFFGLLFLFIFSSVLKIFKNVSLNPESFSEESFQESPYFKIINFSTSEDPDSSLFLFGSNKKLLLYDEYEGGLISVYNPSPSSYNLNVFSEPLSGLNNYIVVLDKDSVLNKKKEIIKKQDSLIGKFSNFIQNRDQQEFTQEKILDYKQEIKKEQTELVYRINLELKPFSEDQYEYKISGAIISDFEEEDSPRFSEKREVLKNSFTNVLNAIVVEVSLEEAKEIEKLEGVKKVYLDKEVSVSLMDSVPLIYANYLQYGGLTGEGVTIGIIDTGVDYTHGDLGECTTEEFLAGTCGKVVGGYDFINNDNNPMDDHGHGTHVAATAAGNGVLKGVAPDADIYAYKVLSSSGSGLLSGVISAIEMSVDPNQDGYFSDHLDVISLSLGSSGGNPDDPASIALDSAMDNGVIAVVAAGNSGPKEQTIGSPGTSRKAITVGAIDKDKEIATFSSRGPVINGEEILNKPDVVAPGVNICAAEWDSAWSDKKCFDHEHVAISGTSMATPHVAGAAALLRQIFRDMTPVEIKQRIMDTATDLGEPINSQGAGLINLVAASGISNGELVGVVTPYGKNFKIIPNSRYIFLEQQYTIISLYEDNLNFDISSGINYPGVSSSLNISSIYLPSKGKASFKLNLNIDLETFDFSNYLNRYNGTIRIIGKGNNFDLSTPFFINIADVVNFDRENIELGFFNPLETSWENSSSFYIKNVKTDSLVEINSTINFLGYKESFNGKLNPLSFDISDNFYLSEKDFSLGPSENKQLILYADFENINLPNGVYFGEIIFGSKYGDSSIKFNFIKRNLLRINILNDLDSHIPFVKVINSSGAEFSSYNMGGYAFPLIIGIDSPGIYTLYLEGWYNKAVTAYFKQNIDIGGLTDVYVDFEEANKYINCNLLDNSGKPVFYDSGFFSFNQGMVWLGSVCDADNPKRFTSHPDFSFEAGTNYVPFYKNQSIYSLLGNTPQLAAKTLS